MLKSDLTKFERTIINAILDANSHKNKAIIDQLRKQIECIMVLSREYTGVGFFTEFQMKKTNIQLEERFKIQLSNIHVEMNGLLNGAGFILYIIDGKISILEGYTYDEAWPRHMVIKKITQNT